jgi:hypothetical protein
MEAHLQPLKQIFPADWGKDAVADKKDKDCLWIMEQIVNQYP